MQTPDKVFMLKYWSFIFDYLRIWVRSSPEQMHFLPQSIKLVCFQRLITVLTAVLLPSTFIFGWQKLQMFAKIFANSDKVRSEKWGELCANMNLQASDQIWSGVWWKVVDSLHLSHSWFISLRWGPDDDDLQLFPQQHLSFHFLMQY